MALRRCDDVWGGVTVLESDPALVHVRDALYLPTSPEIFLDQYTEWGIYDANGTLVPEAAYCRLPARHLVGQSAQLSRSYDAEMMPRGQYLYGGPVIMHYGHFVVTALARLWPLVRDGLSTATKIVVHSQHEPTHWFEHDYARSILGALGLTPDRFVRFDRPVQLPLLAIPRPAFEEQNYVHRVFADVCELIGHKVLGQAGARTDGGPVYLSKARHRFGTARLLNEAAIDAVVSAAGITVVHPETLNFESQVKLISNARCVAGTIGSGFHTSLFSGLGRQIIGLAYDRRVNANYVLIDNLIRNQASYWYTDGIEETSVPDSTFAYIARDPIALGHAICHLILGDKK